MWIRRRYRWLAFALLIGVAAVAVPSWIWRPSWEPPADGVFLVKPYLQWGARSQSGTPGSLEVLWQGADRDEGWSLEVRAAGRSSG